MNVNSIDNEDGTFTVTFNPDDVALVPDIAKAIGVDPGSARAWVNRRLKLDDPNIPNPLFTLNMGRNHTMHVWNGPDLVLITKAYERARALRAEALGA